MFIQHMGRPVIKKVCAKQESSPRLNSSTRGGDGCGAPFEQNAAPQLTHISYIKFPYIRFGNISTRKVIPE